MVVLKKNSYKIAFSSNNFLRIKCYFCLVGKLIYKAEREVIRDEKNIVYIRVWYFDDKRVV